MFGLLAGASCHGGSVPDCLISTEGLAQLELFCRGEGAC